MISLLSFHRTLFSLRILINLFHLHRWILIHIYDKQLLIRLPLSLKLWRYFKVWQISTSSSFAKADVADYPAGNNNKLIANFITYLLSRITAREHIKFIYEIKYPNIIALKKGIVITYFQPEFIILINKNLKSRVCSNLCHLGLGFFENDNMK